MKLFNILRCHVSCRATSHDLLFRETSDDKSREIKFSHHKMWFALKMWCEMLRKLILSRWVSVVTMKLNSKATSDWIQYCDTLPAAVRVEKEVLAEELSFESFRMSASINRGELFQLFHLFHYNPHDILFFFPLIRLMHKRWSVIIKFSRISISKQQSTVIWEKCSENWEDKAWGWDCWNMLI